MKRAILALAVLAPLAARAQTEPVSLTLRLKAGQTQAYRITSDTAMKATLPGGGEKSLSSRSVATFDLSVERVNPDGSYAIRVKRTSHSLSVDGDDAVTAAVGNAEATATLSPDGRYSNLSPAAGKDDGPTGSTPEDFLSTVFDDEVGLPSRPVAVGDRWKDKVQSPVDPEQPKLTVNSRLIAVDDTDGKRVARVLRIIAEPVKASPQKDVSSEGTLEAGSFATSDVATGLTLDERDVVRLKMNITLNPSAAPSVQTGTDSNIRIHIEAIPTA